MLNAIALFSFSLSLSLSLFLLFPLKKLFVSHFLVCLFIRIPHSQPASQSASQPVPYQLRRHRSPVENSTVRSPAGKPAVLFLDRSKHNRQRNRVYLKILEKKKKEKMRKREREEKVLSTLGRPTWIWTSRTVVDALPLPRHISNRNPIGS